MYRIIFRTCDTVHSVHKAERPFGLSKRALIELCFRSLKKSLEGYPHSIHIIADNLSPEMTAFFRGYDVTMTEGTYGNDESIRVSLKQAFSYDDSDWVYICEDDYLHQKQTFLWVDELIENRKELLLTKPKNNLKRWALGSISGALDQRPLFIHPPDYPDRYLPRERERSLLFLSKYCHWRQITNTTFTFMAEAKTLKLFRQALERSASGANDGYLSRTIFARDHFIGRALCLSPIPGLTTHMHEGVMTPLVNWKQVMDETLGAK
jgi:hypothetical protein